MQIRFLGKETRQGDSPTLYATDRETYIVQGWRVTDPEIVRILGNIPQEETCVEIPPRLLTHLPADGLHGSVAFCALPIVHVTGQGTYIVQGKRVSDSQALWEMAVPDNEDAVEVSKAALRALLKEDGIGADHTPAAR